MINTRCNASMKTIEGGLWGQRNAANELKGTIIWGLENKTWWASWGATGYWGNLWTDWINSGGEQGEDDAKPDPQLADRCRALHIQAHDHILAAV